jgi:hypothetical protein
MHLHHGSADKLCTAPFDSYSAIALDTRFGSSIVDLEDASEDVVLLRLFTIVISEKAF